MGSMSCVFETDRSFKFKRSLKCILSSNIVQLNNFKTFYTFIIVCLWCTHCHPLLRIKDQSSFFEDYLKIRMKRRFSFILYQVILYQYYGKFNYILLKTHLITSIFSYTITSMVYHWKLHEHVRVVSLLFLPCGSVLYGGFGLFVCFVLVCFFFRGREGRF